MTGDNIDRADTKGETEPERSAGGKDATPHSMTGETIAPPRIVPREPVPPTGAQSAEHLKQQLEQCGDARKTWRWHDRTPDYIEMFDLTAADIPQLLFEARQWVDREDWPKDKDDVTGYAPIHAWRSLAQLGSVEAVDLLLGMMGPTDDLIDDWYLEEFPYAFALIGPASNGPLKTYLADDGNCEFGRICVAHGLEEVAQRHPECRGEAVATLSEQLEQFQTQPKTLNAYLISPLRKLHATEAADVIERAFAADRVDIEAIGNWNSVRGEMDLEDHGLVPYALAWESPSLYFDRCSRRKKAKAGKVTVCSPKRYKRRKRTSR